MRRREFIVLVGGAILVWPQAVHARPRGTLPRIGFLMTVPFASPMGQRVRRAFWQGMRTLGWIEGQNILVEYRSAEGKLERFRELASDLVRRDVDLIVAGATSAAVAARSVTNTIPIVCFTMADPVGEGLIASLGRPGGNVTGLSNLVKELVPKCLSILKEAVPKATLFAAIWQPSVRRTWPAGAEYLDAAKATAQTLGVDLLQVPAERAEELSQAFSMIRQVRAEAVFVVPNPVWVGQHRRIADLALQHRLPSMSWSRQYVNVGGLMSYGSSVVESFRQGATYVDQILKGTNPAVMPVQQPTHFELVINAKTAKALRLSLPQTLLTLADEVIE